MSALVPIAAVRNEIADFVSALITVYIILIIAYIVVNLVITLRGSIPYSGWSSALLGFLRDVVEPYLSIFRRFIPPIGPLDISPIVAILLLQIVGLGIIGPIIDG